MNSSTQGASKTQSRSQLVVHAKLQEQGLRALARMIAQQYLHELRAGNEAAPEPDDGMSKSEMQ